MDDNPHKPLSNRTLVAQSPLNLEAPLNGLVWPVHFSTMYTRDDTYAYASEYVYGRADNPTVRQAEALVASLEGSALAMLFGSGMAAAITVILALERPIHIIASSHMYYGLRDWFEGVGRYGHTIAFADMADLAAFEACVNERQPGLVWIETPSNPIWEVTDIAAVARIAHDAGAILCVDSTVATPVFTRPLELGADIVMHSATKYLNGHSDVSAGALVAARADALWRRIGQVRSEHGSSLGAHEAWLLARGLRTLHVRVRAQARTAAFLAERLRDHPAVARMLYPGLPGHPGHPIAARQMTGGFGGMFSARVNGGAAAALRVAGATRLWKRATSLGGVESLIEHRASMEGPRPQCPDDLLRFSVGIEDPDDLLADLDQAFRSAL